VQLPASERLQFRAGQYMDFILKDGARRQYSMATAPHADELIQLHIRHTPGGAFTDRLFGVVEPPVKERDILRIEAPLGTFFLREDNARPIVLLAGGTGFAPIKAIAEHIFHERINVEDSGKPAREVRLYWGARSRADLYLDALPEPVGGGAAELPLRAGAVRAEGGRRVDRPHGLRAPAVMEDLPDLSGHQVYACGAPPMIDAARRDFAARCGLPEDQFFADAFTTQADLASA
jgi:CDP-4-dehydro-6-deoxyglucose reductase, E3